MERYRYDMGLHGVRSTAEAILDIPAAHSVVRILVPVSTDPDSGYIQTRVQSFCNRAISLRKHSRRCQSLSQQRPEYAAVARAMVHTETTSGGTVLGGGRLASLSLIYNALQARLRNLARELSEVLIPATRAQQSFR
jgi:hypothetical protein